MGAPMPLAGRYFPAAEYNPGNGKNLCYGWIHMGQFTSKAKLGSMTRLPILGTLHGRPSQYPMGGAGYSIIGQFAYLAGQWNSGLGSTDHYQYDIVGDSWTARGASACCDIQTCPRLALRHLGISGWWR